MMQIRWLILCAYFLLCPTANVFVDEGTSNSGLEQELKHLEVMIQKEGDRNQYPVVEQAMDRMIEVMKQLGYPAEDIAKRTHLRIRYSLSVERFFTARQSALAWIEDHPDDLVALNLYATAATNMDRFLEARPALKTVYESEPTNTIYQRRYLYVLKKLNDREEGLRLCRIALADRPNDERLVEEMIDGLLLFGAYDEALQSLPILSGLNPASSYLHYVQGIVMQEERKWEEAIQSFGQVPSIAEEYTDSVFRQGLCYLQSRQFEPAAYRFIELLSHDPFVPKYHVNLAQSLARMRKREGARLVQAISKRLSDEYLPQGESYYLWRNGDMVESARLRSIALNIKGKFREAQDLLQTTCELIPDSTQAVVNLGQHYFTTLQACKAEETFRQVMAVVSPQEQLAIQLKLAESLLRQDRPDEVAAFIEAEDDAKQKESYHALLGTYYLEIKNDPEQALAYLSLIPNATHRVVAAKARCWVELGDADQAFACFEELPEEYSDPVHDMMKMKCLAMRGQMKQAKGLYENAMSRNPDLSPLILVPVQAVLAKADPDYDEEAWRNRTERMLQMTRTIQQKVIQAQRKGWPKSIPILVELSKLYRELGMMEEARLFARRAFEGDPQRSENLLHLIDCMTDEQRIFERYHFIRRAQADTGIPNDFSNEIHAIYSHIQLTPPSDRDRHNDNR